MEAIVVDVENEIKRVGIEVDAIKRKIYHYQLKPGRVQELAEMGIRSYGIFKDDIERFLSVFVSGKE